MIHGQLHILILPSIKKKRKEKKKKDNCVSRRNFFVWPKRISEEKGEMMTKIYHRPQEVSLWLKED